MQKYIIDSFEVFEDGLNKIYNRDERSGNYTYLDTTDRGGIIEQVKGREDFLCLSNSFIRSVTRQETDRNTTRESFTIGERIHTSPGSGSHYVISSMFIEQGDFILGLDVHIPNNRIRLVNAIKYVEPLRTQAILEVKKKVGRPSNKDKFFEELQTKIEAITPILRLTATLKRRKETPEEFLTKFFKEWNIAGNDKAKNTLVSETGNMQTISGKRRSMGDIYMIMKYYYPTITLKEVSKLLYIRMPEIITRGYRSCKCSQILKRVWWYQQESTNNINQREIADEYGNVYDKYIEMLNN